MFLDESFTHLYISLSDSYEHLFDPVSRSVYFFQYIIFVNIISLLTFSKTLERNCIQELPFHICLTTGYLYWDDFFFELNRNDQCRQHNSHLMCVIIDYLIRLLWCLNCCFECSKRDWYFIHFRFLWNAKSAIDLAN